MLIHNATDLAFRAPDPVELLFAGAAGVSFASATRVSIGLGRIVVSETETLDVRIS